MSCIGKAFVQSPETTHESFGVLCDRLGEITALWRDRSDDGDRSVSPVQIVHHAGALVKSGQAGRQISRESFFGGHLFQAAGQLAQSFCPTGGGVCHDRYIISHIPVVFCQCQTGVDAGFTGSNRHVGSISDQCSAVHQRISGLWVDQFSEFLQNLCHLVSTFSASDIDNDISVRPLGNLMLCHGLSGSESAGNGGSSAFGDWEHGINDTLSGDKWD